MSSGISFSGLSGIDTKGIIAQLMTIERRPLDKLEAKIETQQSRLSVMSELRTKLSSFRTSISQLNTSREFRQMSISTTDTDDEHFSVSADSSAQMTNHTVKVMSLASYEKEVSQTFTDVDEVIATGNITITLGSGESRTVTIDSTNNTVAGLRGAINNLDWGLDADEDENPGVTASLLNDGSGYRLIIGSDETGSDNTITLDTSGLSGPDTIPVFTQTQTAVDGHVVFDGVDVYSSDNKISDIVTGLDLTLKKADTEEEYRIDVSSNTDAIAESITGFVDEYNELMAYLNDKAGAGTRDRDPTISSLLREMRSISYTSVNSGGDFSLLSQIGISNTREGTLEIDSDDLRDAIEDNFDDVVKLLTAYGDTSNPSVSYLRSGASTEVGTYAIEITGVGENLAGTIGGYGAYVYGEHTLVGANDTPAEGLAIYFTGSALGSYGDITFSAGVFESFDRLIDRYMDTTEGIIQAKEATIDSQIRYTEQRIERVQRTLERTEARLTYQFTQMEIALQNMQTQSSSLSNLSSALF
jgi:flagellar hook-associated protein 2